MMVPVLLGTHNCMAAFESIYWQNVLFPADHNGATEQTEDCLAAIHLMIGRVSFVLMGKSLHSPLNLLFDGTWKFHSAFVSTKMCRLLPCAASGVQAANTEVPGLMKLVIIHC